MQAMTAPEQAVSQVSRGSLATGLYALLTHVHKNCTADLFEAIGELDLTITQTKLLGRLEHAEAELTLKDAAQLLGVSLPAASRAVDDLVRRDMVARHEDCEDRRMKRIRLTPTGEAMIRHVNAARMTGLQQFVQSLTEDERSALEAALSRLLARPDVAACRPEGDLSA